MRSWYSPTSISPLCCRGRDAQGMKEGVSGCLASCCPWITVAVGTIAQNWSGSSNVAVKVFPLWMWKIYDIYNPGATLDNNGFVCGDKKRWHSKHFHNRRSVRCGDAIEANYSKHWNQRTSASVSVQYAMCYAICMPWMRHCIPPEEIIANRDVRR